MERIATSFFTGINYWGSQDAINMWQNFDPVSIEKDLQLMQSAGITHLRVFPLWPVFQPLHALYGPKDVYEYTFGEDPLPDTPAGRAGVSEEACRENVSREVTLQLDGNRLPIKAKYFYHPESAVAETLGCDENGEGVFLRYPYGKGWVYLLTLPLEAHLAEKQGAFFKDDQPPHHLVYRHLAKAAGVSRICDSDHPYVRLTEHPLDENTLYVTAINYANKPATAKLTVAPGYAVTPVYGEGMQGNTLTLNENSGIVLKLQKK